MENFHDIIAQKIPEASTLAVTGVIMRWPLARQISLNPVILHPNPWRKKKIG